MPMIVCVPLNLRKGPSPQTMTVASVPVPVAPGFPRQHGTLARNSAAVLASVTTWTAQTIAERVSRALVTSIMLMVPGPCACFMQIASPARTALVTPAVKNPSTQRRSTSSRKTTNHLIGTAVISPTQSSVTPTSLTTEPK